MVTGWRSEQQMEAYFNHAAAILQHWVRCNLMLQKPEAFSMQPPKFIQTPDREMKCLSLLGSLVGNK